MSYEIIFTSSCSFLGVLANNILTQRKVFNVFEMIGFEQDLQVFIFQTKRKINWVFHTESVKVTVR
jgi:hypothetical protein